MLGIKKFSWPWFLIGLGSGVVIGALALGLLVNYLISNAISGASTDGLLLGSSVDQVREGISKINAEKETKSVYGHVVSIGGGTMVIEVAQIEGSKQYTFKYDDKTTFVYIAADAASSEQALSTDTIVPGTGLNVYTADAVGSVADQYAVKVIKI